jgi:hypothetical protein
MDGNKRIWTLENESGQAFFYKFGHGFLPFISLAFLKHDGKGLSKKKSHRTRFRK